ERHKKVADTRRLIYDQQYVVDTPQVEVLLKEESLVPTKNMFSERLSHAGFDFFLMLVVDLLHEFELGVWKAVFIHLLWMLDSLKGRGLPELDQRYCHVPTFGRSTICRFRRNVSELKKMAAHDFEDMLQASLSCSYHRQPLSHSAFMPCSVLCLSSRGSFLRRMTPKYSSSYFSLHIGMGWLSCECIQRKRSMC
ncbi:hypothetical protein PAXINDRAFT_86583, partial [Paxillus involutus ATCC 200175]